MSLTPHLVSSRTSHSFAHGPGLKHGATMAGRRSSSALSAMVAIKLTSVPCKFLTLWASTKKVLPKTLSAAKRSLPISSSKYLLECIYKLTLMFYRYTSQVMVTANGEVSSGACPVQIIFCLKEQNKKKLNSHRWFFNAFGPLIKPNVCILLDVGTKPTGTSIYELWKCKSTFG